MSKTVDKIPKQGEIWLADFNRKREKENFKIRPVLILSNDWQNKHDKYAVVAPLTSDEEELKNIASFEVLIEPNEKNGLDNTSKILLNRLQIIDKNHRLIGERKGQVNSKIWAQAWKALWIVFTGKNLG